MVFWTFLLFSLAYKVFFNFYTIFHMKSLEIVQTSKSKSFMPTSYLLSMFLPLTLTWICNKKKPAGTLNTVPGNLLSWITKFNKEIFYFPHYCRRYSMLHRDFLLSVSNNIFPIFSLSFKPSLPWDHLASTNSLFASIRISLTYLSKAFHLLPTA